MKLKERSDTNIIKQWNIEKTGKCFWKMGGMKFKPSSRKIFD
jgi:hypothetical protein